MSTDYQDTTAKKFINAILFIQTKGLHKEDVWLPLYKILLRPHLGKTEFQDTFDQKRWVQDEKGQIWNDHRNLGPILLVSSV